MSIRQTIPLVEDFCEFLLGERRLSEATCRCYRADLIEFIEFLKSKFKIGQVVRQNETNAWEKIHTANVSGNCSLNTATIPTTVVEAFVGASVETIKSFLEHLKNLGRKPTTINRKIACLKTTYGWLFRTGITESDRMESIKMPRVCFDPVTSRVDLSAQIVTSLLGVIDDSRLLGARDVAIIALCRFMGLTPKDVVSIRCSDVDLERGVITLRFRRSGNQCMSIPRDVLPSIENYADLLNQKKEEFSADLSKDPFFLNRSGKKITQRSIHRSLRRYAKLAGLDSGINPSMLRRCFIVEMIVGGSDIREVKRVAGHRDTSTTTRYLPLARGVVREVTQETSAA